MLNVGGVTWLTAISRRGTAHAERQAEASLHPRRLRGARCLNLTAEARSAQRDKLKPLCALGVSAVHAADSTFKRRIPRCWGVLR